MSDTTPTTTEFDHEALSLCEPNQDPQLVKFARKCIDYGRRSAIQSRIDAATAKSLREGAQTLGAVAKGMVAAVPDAAWLAEQAESMSKGDDYELVEDVREVLWKCAVALRKAVSAPAAGELSQRIMNVQANPSAANGASNLRQAYLIGHLDARHAAAELALAPTPADAELLARLEAAEADGVDRRQPPTADELKTDSCAWKAVLEIATRYGWSGSKGTTFDWLRRELQMARAYRDIMEPGGKPVYVERAEESAAGIAIVARQIAERPPQSGIDPDVRTLAGLVAKLAEKVNP